MAAENVREIRPMTPDEKMLLNCTDDDIAVVTSYADPDDPAADTLERALDDEKPLIAVKNAGLARETALFIGLGKIYHNATVLTALTSMVFASGHSHRLSKAFAMLSVLFGGSYYMVWHYDPIYRDYHVLENPRLLAFLGSRYRRGTFVVLIRNCRRIPLTVPVASSVLAAIVAFAGAYFMDNRS